MTIDSGQLAIAMGGAIILVAVIIVIAFLIHWSKISQSKDKQTQSGKEKKDLLKNKYLFLIISDENGHPSLSKFQFLLWTIVVSILYITLWLLLLRNGIIDAPPAIPISLIGLMGLSVFVPVANQAIIDYKKTKYRPVGETFIGPEFASMLEEQGKPSLLRMQMFLWTIAAIVIYFGSFIASALSPEMVLKDFGLPEVDPTLIFLMGVSQTGYLGSAAFSGNIKKGETKSGGSTGESIQTIQTTQKDQKPGLVISETIPNVIRPGEVMTLLGSGFGFKKDILMLGNKKIEVNDIQRWDNSRIEFKIPSYYNSGMYPIKIIVGNNSLEKTININGEGWFKKGENPDVVPAEIISEIWIDDPVNQAYKVPPIGHFIKDKRYYFFFEFDVPPGAGAWDTKFTAYFSIKKVGGEDEQKPKKGEFLPGHLNGNNYGVFDHKFEQDGKYEVEISGMTTKTMTIEVKPPEPNKPKK